MRSRGWVEGQNLILEMREANPPSGDPAAYVDLARELVGLFVDVILTSGTPATLAAQQVTDRIPIVFTVDNPVGNGLVASLAHPDGNATGVNHLDGSGLITKRLELLAGLVPKVRRVAFLSNPSNSANAAAVSALQAAAPTLDIEVKNFDVRSAADLETVFADLAAWPAGGVLVTGGEPFGSARERIGQLALQRRLPTMPNGASGFGPGMLGYYTIQTADPPGIMARQVDQILRGARPRDLPVEVPTHFDYLLSRSTFDTLGLAPAQDDLARVTQWVD